MSNKCALTVVLSTFNRVDLLGTAIERVLAQSATAPPFELLIVDNNSTDGTRGVVEHYMRRAGGRLSYVFEARPGLSYARNAGTAAAAADIVAFTDDDVRVGDDWVAAIKTTFDRHPDVDCLGGRILPEWPSPPPAWLTRLHWVGPLALQDYGEEPFVIDARQALCLAGANVAFRKRIFNRIGLFSPEYPRAQDTELMLRLWSSGARALYVPHMITYAAVQPERLAKAYHRKWHSMIGRINARMAFEERMEAGGGLRVTVPHVKRIMGVPLFGIKELARQLLRWCLEIVRRRESQAFWHEVQVRSILGYMRESAALYRCRSLNVAGTPAQTDAAIRQQDVLSSGTAS